MKLHTNSFLASTLIFSLYAMEEQSLSIIDPYQEMQAIELSTMDDIPRAYAELSHQVMQRPVANGKQYLCINNHDARIVELLNESANALKIPHLKIASFQLFPWCHNEEAPINHGLILQTSEENATHTVPKLMSIYSTVVAQLKERWIFEKREYYKSPRGGHVEYWYCFTKETPLQEEDTLIRFILGKLWLFNLHVCCHKDTENHHSLPPPYRKIGLAIKEGSYAMAKERLSFNLPSEEILMVQANEGNTL